MRDSLAGPATVAIGLGIVFVMMFSLAFAPVTTLSDAQLISRSKQIEDVQYFLAKYPDAMVEVHRDAEKATVAYIVSRQFEPTDEYPNGVVRKRILAIDYTGDSTFGMRMHCSGTPNPLATVAYGKAEGDMVGRIDNEGCFGRQ